MGAIPYDQTASSVPSDGTGPPGPSNDAEPLSMDDVFETLSNERRRCVIRYLNEIDGRNVRVRDLAEQIAAWQNDVSVHEVTYKERKRVYTSLYQLHLEKMDRLGVVSYDQNEGTVSRTPVTGQLHRYFGSSADDADGHVDSFGLSVLCAAVVAAAWAGLLPFASGAGFAIAFAVASVLVVVTGTRVLGGR